MPHRQKVEKMKNNKIGKSIITMLVVFTVSAFALTACGGGSESSDGGDKSSSSAKTFDVALYDNGASMSIEGDPISVPSGTEVTLNVTNTGTVVHNLKLDGGPSTADLPVSSSASLELGKLTESTTVYCTIPGHKEQGMVFDITVK